MATVAVLLGVAQAAVVRAALFCRIGMLHNESGFVVGRFAAALSVTGCAVRSLVAHCAITLTGSSILAVRHQVIGSVPGGFASGVAIVAELLGFVAGLAACPAGGIHGPVQASIHKARRRMRLRLHGTVARVAVALLVALAAGGWLLARNRCMVVQEAGRMRHWQHVTGIAVALFVAEHAILRPSQRLFAMVFHKGGIVV